MRKILFFIILGAATTVVLALAAYFELGPFEPRLEVGRMLFRMSSLQTVKFKVGASRSYEKAGQTTSALATGALSLEHPDSLEQASDFRVVSVARFAPGSDLHGQVKAIDQNTYLRFDSPPVFEERLLAPASGIWLRYHHASGMPLIRAFLPEAKIFGPESSAWSKQNLPMMRALFANADVLHISYSGQVDLIGSVKTRVFNARFDPEAVRVFYLDLVRAKTGREPQPPDRQTAVEISEFLAPLYLRLWIGIGDHWLYRLHAAGIRALDADRQAVDLKIEFFDFNALFAPAAPDSFIDYSDWLVQKRNLPQAGSALDRPIDESVPGSDFSGFARLPSQEIGFSPVFDLDSDQDGLSDLLELFYGTDKNHWDTDRDGMSDGEEVLRGRNPKGHGSLFGFGLDG